MNTYTIFFKLNFWRVFAIWPNCALCVLGCIIRKISYFIFHHQENWCDFISEHVGVCCCCQPFSCHGYNVKTLRKLIKEPWMTWQKRWFIVLKVSRSRNKIVEPQILPKNEWTNLFFYPDGPKILETWNRNSSFKYFRTVRIEKQIRPFRFGRSFFRQFCFWDLRTFSMFVFDAS